MTNVVLFNFKGTIVDTKAVAIDAYNDTAEKQGYKKIAKQDVSSLRSLSIRERCKILQISIYKIPLIGIAIKRSYQQCLPSLTPVAELKECLEDLKQHDEAFLNENLESVVENLNIEVLATNGYVFLLPKTVQKQLFQRLLVWGVLSNPKLIV